MWHEYKASKLNFIDLMKNIMRKPQSDKVIIGPFSDDHFVCGSETLRRSNVKGYIVCL